MTPQYTAVSAIEIARDSSKVTDFQGVERETSALDQEFYQTQYGLLRSRALSERIANQLRLVDDAKFFAMFGYKKDSPAFKLTRGAIRPMAALNDCGSRAKFCSIIYPLTLRVCRV
ncbi:hypothetical protein SPKIRA_37470 (plasmid) [Sphingomonas paucimobilis]|nr:hypothetical protein SPKIRA_37470 [Sphingomonas paucimobilis]